MDVSFLIACGHDAGRRNESSAAGLAKLKLKAKQHDEKMPESFRWFKNISESPAAIAIITGSLGIITAIGVNGCQASENAKLEKQKFRSAAFVKAIDLGDTEQAAQYLAFLVKTGVLDDADGTIKSFTDNPATLPIFMDAKLFSALPQELRPDVKEKVNQMIAFAKDELGIDLVMIEGFRSFQAQEAMYAEGRTTSGPIRTVDKGGESGHNCGIAFDIGQRDTQGNITASFTDDQWNKLFPFAEKIGLAATVTPNLSNKNRYHLQLRNTTCKDIVHPQKATK